MRKYSFFEIWQKFFLGILTIVIWTFKHLKRLFGLKLFTFFILKPSLIYKSYKSIRWLINITFTTFGAVFLAPFNFLGLNDLFSDFFDLLGLKKIAPTQVEQIKEIVTATKNKVADKIIDSDIPVVSESLRQKYKNSYFDGMSTTERITAIITFAIISAIIMFFLGPDILNFFKGFLPQQDDDDDTTPPAPPAPPAPQAPTENTPPKKWYNL